MPCPRSPPLTPPSLSPQCSALGAHSIRALSQFCVLYLIILLAHLSASDHRQSHHSSHESCTHRSDFRHYGVVASETIHPHRPPPHHLHYSPPSHDLPVQWTLHGQIPIKSRHKVKPIFRVNGSSANTLHVSFDQNLASNTLPFSHMELDLTTDLETVPHNCSNNTNLPFVSRNFVFAQQRIVEDFDYDITEERHTRGGYLWNLQQSNLTTLIETQNENQGDPLDKECRLLMGRIVNEEFGNTTRSKVSHPPANTIGGIGLPSSAATFSLCSHGRLNGIITWPSHGHLLVEPIADKCHVELASSSEHDGPVFESCEHWVSFVPIPKDSFTADRKSSRTKRSVSVERTIEILVVTDWSMSIFHGSTKALEAYVHTLMASVSHIFKHSSIGNEINIRLVKIINLHDAYQDQYRSHEAYFFGGSAQNTLRRFCDWQSHNNLPVDHPQHHDIAILLTRRDLCRKNSNNGSPSHSCDTIGLAHSGQICDPKSSCAIVEDTGLSAAFTIAHELGHVLGIPHDDEEKCKQFYANEDGKSHQPKQKESNVMARMIDITSNMWSWSACSRHFITDYLDSGNGDCLLDKPDEELLSSEPHHPYHQPRSIHPRVRQSGESYDANQQCRLMFGDKSQVCSDMPVCMRLWCTHSGPGCRTQHMPWADGTMCASDRWCQQGQCVPINPSAMEPIDGDWSDWSAYSKCSLPCGGGIMRAKRECDNPRPRNGGKFCLGERIKYKSCNTEPCDSPDHDVRAEQCAKFNGQNFKIANVDTNVEWLPHHNPTDECKLFCTESRKGNFYMLKERVIDGTPCSPGSYGICVNGKCLSAGCDHILGSNRTLDRCGKCGGDSTSCHEISGNYRPRSVIHGYNSVVTIPRGASSIEIFKTNSPDSWLAIRTEDDNYLLNGKYIVNIFPRKWHYAGTTIEYSGHNKSQGTERINTTRPIEQTLYIQVLCVSPLTVPMIEYRYMVETQYQWIPESRWTKCNRECFGEEQQRSICISIVAEDGRTRRERVDDRMCHSKQRPAHKSRVCNNHCEFAWNAGHFTECSAKCGAGTRTRQVVCTKITNGQLMEVVPDDRCSHLNDKPTESESCTGERCNIRYQWGYDVWSQCTFPIGTNCGEGNQTRQVLSCISSYQDRSGIVETSVNFEECKHIGHPVTSQTCKVDCPFWFTHEWSECSDMCEKIRKVVCMHGSKEVHKEYCAHETKPQERERCNECPQAIMPQLTSDHEETLKRTTGYFYPESIPTSLNSIDDQEPHPINSLKAPHHGFTKEKILWRVGDWTPECLCDPQNRTYVQKRLVLCMRFFLQNGQIIPDGNPNISEVYCLQNQPEKPLERRPCIPSPNTVLDAACSQSIETNSSLTPPLPPLASLAPSYSSLTAISSTVPTITPSLLTPTTSLISGTLLPATSSPHRRGLSVAPSETFSTTVTFESSTYQSIPNPEVPLPSPSFPNVAMISSDPMNRKADTVLPSVTIEASSTTASAIPARSEKSSNHLHSLNLQHWRYGEWSRCVFANNATCGKGAKTREAICRRGQTCNPILKPPAQSESCEKQCPLYGWHYSAWSPCSALCGEGVRTRSVECHDWTGAPVRGKFCNDTRMEASSEPCESKCSMVWQTGHWSECSKSCDTGMQTRPVTCHRVNSYGFVDPRPLSNPLSSLTRHKRGKFQQDGRRSRASRLNSQNRIPEQHQAARRNLRHRKRHNNEVNYNYTDESYVSEQFANKRSQAAVTSGWCDPQRKPAESRACNLGQCFMSPLTDSYVWKPMQWQPCQASCGDGKQHRRVYCYSTRRGALVDNSLCPIARKPETTRECNLRECNVISCKDHRDRGLSRHDGEYDIWLQGTMVRVYCFGMNTLAEPLEYLALNSDDDNYSQLISYQGNCPSIASNRTNLEVSFKYVRLNITSMQLSVSDTLFAMVKDTSTSITAYYQHDMNAVMSTQSLEYGKALVQGCATMARRHSITKCHFGSRNYRWPSSKAKFSINLQRTGLQMTPEADWDKVGPEEIVFKRFTWIRTGQKFVVSCGLRGQSFTSRTSTSCQVGCQPANGIIQLMVP